MGNNYDGDQLQFDINVKESARTYDSGAIAKYWDLALVIINLWSSYQGRCRLYNTASNPNTRFRVVNVIRKYYKGSMSELMKFINQDAEELKQLIEEFEDLCIKFNVEKIGRGWLDTHITDGKIAASYRGKIQTKLKNRAVPISLKDLPPYQPRPKKH